MAELARSGAFADKGCRQPLFVWFPAAALLAFVATSLWFSYAQQVTQAENKALTLARAVEQHATATLERASLGILLAMKEIRPQDLDGDRLSETRQEELKAILAREQARLGGVVSLTLVNAKGLALASSVGKVKPIDIGQRPYFQQLKGAPSGAMAISEVIQGKVSGKWGLHVARRIDLPSGRFGGVVVANLGLRENFDSFYESLGVGQRGLITLRAQDNTVLVRYPVVESALGKPIQGSQGTLAVAQQVSEKVLRSVSPIDHVDRIVAVRKLPDHPIYAVVGLPFQEVVLAWLWDSAALLVMSAMMLALAIVTSMMVQHRFAMHKELEILSARLEASNWELLEANAKIEKQSLQDQLTGAWNRRFADLRLKEALAQADRDGREFSLLMFDLDHFKDINDRWGHQVGDRVLVEFVRLIQGRLRTNDILARWGGEEFLLLLEGSDADSAAMLAEHLRAAVETYDFGSAGKLTVTIGVAQHRAGEDEQELIHRVDTALYAAKRAGRNRVRKSDSQAALPD